VRLDSRGAVEVNEFLQSTTNSRVYATGDVALPPGSLPLTPVAAHEGAVVASNLLQGNKKRPDYRGIPSVVFTLPPLAGVGLTEKAARAEGLSIRVESNDTTEWFSNRRLLQSAGMYKIIIDADTDRLLGAHILGTNAEEVINLFAVAIRFGITATDLKQTIYAYPTSASNLPDML
jgi:glutathione reductase (NADPH)